MVTLVEFKKSRRSAPAAAALVADYLVFDRRRRNARPFIHAFAGFALITLIGGALGSVPRIESVEAAGVFVAPVALLLAWHATQWWRINRRLHALRAEMQIDL